MKLSNHHHIDGPIENMNEQDAVGKVTGFFLFRNVINGYNQDKLKDEEDRKQIKKYGKISLTLSIIAFVLSGVCVVSILSRLELLGFSYVLMLILYIISGIVVSLLFSIYGFVFAVMQVRLNRKSIGIVGIVLSILAIVLAILLIVVLVA